MLPFIWSTCQPGQMFACCVINRQTFPQSHLGFFPLEDSLHHFLSKQHQEAHWKQACWRGYSSPWRGRPCQEPLKNVWNTSSSALIMNKTAHTLPTVQPQYRESKCCYANIYLDVTFVFLNLSRRWSKTLITAPTTENSTLTKSKSNKSEWTQAVKRV